MAIFKRIELWLLKRVLVGEIEEIKISDFRGSTDDFKKRISLSVKLIKEIDKKRFKTVKSEVEWLVNTNSPSQNGAKYSRRNNVCSINFGKFSGDYKLDIAYYAGVIVHEATHGLIERKGITISKENRFQIERICTFEENNFYKKFEALNPKYKGILVHEFNPRNWDYSWNTSKFKQAYHAIKRIIKDKD